MSEFTPLIDRSHGCLSCGVATGAREQSLLCVDCVENYVMTHTGSEGAVIIMRAEGPVELTPDRLAELLREAMRASHGPEGPNELRGGDPHLWLANRMLAEVAR